MHSIFVQYLFLVLIILALNLIADKLRLAYPIVLVEVLERQRALLDEMNQSADFDEELVGKYLSLIDMEEFKLREERLANGES